MINHTLVTPGYFQMLGIPILEGRDFNEGDGKNPLVTIVDEGIAKRYWPHESAVGNGPVRSAGKQRTVAHHRGGGGERSQSVAARPATQFGLPALGGVRMGEHRVPGAIGGRVVDPAKALRARLTAVDRNVAISRVLSMQDVVTQSIWRERFFATIFGFFAVLALLLALVGLYGVMAYTVSRRTHEMGIRMALGATAGEIRGMVLAQSGRLVLAGLAVGTVAAVFLTRLLRTQLFEVSPRGSEDAGGGGGAAGGSGDGGELHSGAESDTCGPDDGTAGRVGRSRGSGGRGCESPFARRCAKERSPAFCELVLKCDWSLYP